MIRAKHNGTVNTMNARKCAYHMHPTAIAFTVVQIFCVDILLRKRMRRRRDVDATLASKTKAVNNASA